MSIFSKNLKFLREEKRLSQNRLAELANVNQTTIARWENEEISPSLDNIYDLSLALNVPIADLAGTDLTNSSSQSFDELELLFSKNKDILSDDDKDTIRFVIERAKRKADEQLDGEQ